MSSSSLHRSRSQYLREPTTSSITKSSLSTSAQSVVPASRQIPSFSYLRRSVSQSFDLTTSHELSNDADDSDDLLNLRHHQKHQQQKLYQNHIARNTDKTKRLPSRNRDEISENGEEEEEEDLTVIMESQKVPQANRRTFSAETVTPETSVESAHLWTALEDLQNRVQKLELNLSQMLSLPRSNSMTSVSRASNGYLRTMLQQAGDAIPDDLQSALEVTASAVEALSYRVSKSDRSVKTKMDALYRSLAELFIVVSGSSTPPPSQHSSDMRSGSSISNRSEGLDMRTLAARLPQRAATRMQQSLETSQLPPELRPASRMASRASSYDYGDDDDNSVFSSTSSLGGSHRRSLIARSRTSKTSPGIARQQMSDDLDYGSQSRQRSLLGSRTGQTYGSSDSSSPVSYRKSRAE